MTDHPIGITFRETMSGGFALGHTDPGAGARAGERAATTLAMHAAVAIADVHRFVSDPTHTGRLTGDIDFAPLGRAIPASAGVLRLFCPADVPNMRYMVYELAFTLQGQDYYLAGHKEVRNGRAGDAWNETTTLLTRLHRGSNTGGRVIGAGVLSLGVADLGNLISTLTATGATSAADKAQAIATFGEFFLGSLWQAYGPRMRAGSGGGNGDS
jgi:cholesterol oxidase